MHPFADTRRTLLAAWAFAIGAAAACGAGGTDAGDSASTCTADGSLSVTIYGGIEADLDWRGADLECSGMPRPDARGARLHFSGLVDRDGTPRRLAFIIALPELSRGGTVRETPAIVTLIEEDSGRFFSTAEAPVCWSDIAQQTPISDDAFAIRGIVYCVSPLAELNGSGGVSFTDLAFSGRVKWGSVR